MNMCSVFVLLFIFSTVSANLIVPPLPLNQVLIEGESMSSSCTAESSLGYPNITYQRKVGFGDFTDVVLGKRINLTTSTRRDTSKGTFIRTSVLHVQNLELDDDNDEGAWHCVASVGADEDKSGFAINVIRKSDLPTGVIRGVGDQFVSEYGSTLNLTCDIIDGTGMIAPLKRVAWERGMTTLKNGSLPTVLEPLVINNVTLRDKGEYRCTGVVHLLSNVYREIILDKTTIYIGLYIVNGTTSVKAAESSEVVMECPAYGYPLSVTWWRQDQEGNHIQLESNERYSVSRPCETCLYKLVIKSMQPGDTGHYICNATSNNEAGIHHFKLSMPIDPIYSSCITIYAHFSLVLLAGLVAWMMH